MGKRGRQSLSASSREADSEDGSAASTPCTGGMVMLSGSKNPGMASLTTPIPGVDKRVGLSWVSVLKGGGSGSGSGGQEVGVASKGGPASTLISAVGGSKNGSEGDSFGSKAPGGNISDSFGSNSRAIGRISKDDVRDEIAYWENFVVCYVTSANPPVQVIDGFVRRIWKNLEIDKIGMVNRGVFLVLFVRKEH